MNSITDEQIKTLLDKTMIDITKQFTGIQLSKLNADISSDACTVYTRFEGGYSATLALCTETSLMTRLTQNIMQQDTVTMQDVEDFAKEYFNVICGRIVAGLFQMTKTVSHFQIPSFQSGHYFGPDEKDKWHILSYMSGQNEGAQLCIM